MVNAGPKTRRFEEQCGADCRHGADPRNTEERKTDEEERRHERGATDAAEGRSGCDHDACGKHEPVHEPVHGAMILLTDYDWESSCDVDGKRPSFSRHPLAKTCQHSPKSYVFVTLLNRQFWDHQEKCIEHVETA